MGEKRVRRRKGMTGSRKGGREGERVGSRDGILAERRD